MIYVDLFRRTKFKVMHGVNWEYLSMCDTAGHACGPEVDLMLGQYRLEIRPDLGKFDGWGLISYIQDIPLFHDNNIIVR